MNIYLAGTVSRAHILATAIERERERERERGIDDLRLFLAGSGIWNYAQEGSNLLNPRGAKTFYVLDSFAYINKPSDRLLIDLIPYFKDFFLDSGAFTFMQGTTSADFDAYLKSYIKFINEHHIKHFFELDIDSVVGYQKVLEYREKLEQGTGRRCIPVWHKSRGQDAFLQMCEDYSYVAIGGIVNKEIPREHYKYFPWFIKEAHKRGTKIHGLGFTGIKGVHKYHFDSVDSSSWTAGNRYGIIFKFTGRGLKMFKKPPHMRVKCKETAINNFVEWVKFAQYAETHL